MVKTWTFGSTQNKIQNKILFAIYTRMCAKEHKLIVSDKH